MLAIAAWSLPHSFELRPGRADDTTEPLREGPSPPPPQLPLASFPSQPGSSGQRHHRGPCRIDPARPRLHRRHAENEDAGIQRWLAHAHRTGPSTVHRPDVPAAGEGGGGGGDRRRIYRRAPVLTTRTVEHDGGAARSECGMYGSDLYISYLYVICADCRKVGPLTPSITCTLSRCSPCCLQEDVSFLGFRLTPIQNWLLSRCSPCCLIAG